MSMDPRIASELNTMAVGQPAALVAVEPMPSALARSSRASSAEGELWCWFMRLPFAGVSTMS
ncbi:hypothetical protein [Arthrobacter sp. HLT1-20]